MGRWSHTYRLLAIAGLCSVTGCTTFDSLFSNKTKNAQGEVLTVPNMGNVTTPAVSSNKHHDPDLAPEKAAKLCIATAEELEKNGHFEQAIGQYELALQHQPKTPGLNKKIAANYATLKKFDKSIEVYQQELKAHPNDADLLNDLGYTFYEKDDLVTAEKYLRLAISGKQNHQRAYGNLGLVLGKQQKWKESLEAFKKAGSPAMAQANLAAMYFAAGNTEEARRSCSIALGMDANLKPAKDLMAKLDSMPKEDSKVQQAEAKLTQTSDATSQMAAADLAKGVQLQRPVRSKPKEPLEFKPVR
jgi:Tfp pilus assembly protein PilF